ncbi:alpha/beta hydrolase [Cryptosporangium sp. NPDC051539]|uniref:alpha/beta hydrolase n=1 Tax=Cryptosporangium sp. NPDC051539 TaxID=3363962 RepID=UPI0037924685
MAQREIEFISGGETVRGDLLLPEGEGPFPVVVMAGGWCYVKELRQPQYAAEFVQRGFAALIFDYRRMGASAGEPRQHIDPWDQIEDYKNAITFASNQPELDADRIGIWGISYSGGHVLIVGATDPRVKAVVSNVPVIDGHETMWRMHGTDRFRKLNAFVAEDRAKRTETGEYGYMAMSGVPANPDDSFSVWPDNDVLAVFNELKATQAPRHEHRNTVASLEMLMEYDASTFAPRLIDKPVMMIVADADDITMWDQEIAAFKAIPSSKKELVVLPATDHMTLYSNVTALDYAAAAAGSWFDRHLRELPTVENQISKYKS